MDPLDYLGLDFMGDPLAPNFIAEDANAERMPKRRRLEEPDRLLGSHYLQFDPIVQTDLVRRCEKLRGMHVGGGFVLDRDYFESVGGTWPRLRDYLGGEGILNDPWYRMMMISGLPAYRALTIEVCSTFTYTPMQQVQFRLSGNWHTFTMAEWAVRTGFYTSAQLEENIYTQSVTTLPRPPLVAFWDYLTDHRHHFGKSNGSVRQLRDPMHRILHHIIARTICPRDLTREKVNLGDIFHLYCLLTGRRANLEDSLAQFLASAHHRKQAGALYGGSFVTYIARRLLFEPSLDDELEVIAPEPFGKTNVLAMGIVGRFDPPWLVSDTRAVVPFEPEDIPAEIPDYRELADGRPDPAHSPLPRHPLFAPQPQQQQAPQQPPQQQQQPPQQPPQQQQQPPQQQQQAPQQQAPQHPQHVYADMMPGMRVFAETLEARLGALETLTETRLDALEQLTETRLADLERRRRRDRDFQRATSTHILAALRLIAPTVQFSPDPVPPQDTDDDAGSSV